jgi:hypothetical protein
MNALRATAVWAAIRDAVPEGVTADDIAHRTLLSLADVRSALADMTRNGYKDRIACDGDQFFMDPAWKAEALKNVMKQPTEPTVPG